MEKKELCLFEEKLGRIQARPQGRVGIIAKFRDKEVFLVAEMWGV